MTDIELSYIAGLFDGEGWVGIHDRPDTKGRMRYCAGIQVGQTNQEILNWLASSFGGRVIPQPFHHTKFPDRKPMFLWYGRGEMVTTFLTAILPYLKIKREAAENVLYFRQNLLGRKGVSLSLDQLEQQRLCSEKSHHFCK